MAEKAQPAPQYNIVVTGKDSVDDVNKAIAMPNGILLKDGRFLDITSWKPIAQGGEIVKVMIEAYILVPDND